MKTENRTLPRSPAKLSVLHVVLSIGPTNCPYNEHCLPMSDKRDITICTYFPSSVVPPGGIGLFQGDATLKGFFRTLSTALGAKRYDVVHAHTPHVALLFLAAHLASLRRRATPAIVTVHDSYPNYRLRNRVMFLPVFAFFDRIVCCSHASFRSFPAVYRWLAGRRLTAVQNAMDIGRVDRVAAAVGRRRPGGQFTIAAVSRLVDIKNPFLLLKAFEQSSHAISRLIYIGDGALRPSLVAARRHMSLEGQIEFTGLIPREKVYEHLLGADLFISTSRGEGLPLAVMEAMACGCPVILSDIPPHREIAEGADFIPIINPDDVAAFAREIDRFKSMPVCDRESIGSKCRRLVEERYSMNGMHERYGKVYSEAMMCMRD